MRVGVPLGVEEGVGGGVGGFGHVIRLTNPLPLSVTRRETPPPPPTPPVSMAMPLGEKCVAVREEALSKEVAAPVPLRVLTPVAPPPTKEIIRTLLAPLSVTTRKYWS